MNTRFCTGTFGANLCAQSMLINKISASEFSRKFIKSALLVGDGITANIKDAGSSITKKKDVKKVTTHFSFFSKQLSTAIKEK